MIEADILQKAHFRYREDYEVPFSHEHSWNILKNYAKWSAVPTMSTHTSRTSKGRKMFGSSEAHFNLNIDDDDEDEDEIEEL